MQLVPHGFVIAGRIKSELCLLNSLSFCVGDEHSALHVLAKNLSLGCTPASLSWFLL